MERTLAEIGEFGLIRRLKKLVMELGAHNEGVTLGIGDDSAVVRPPGDYELLITCDCLVEGRHFLPGQIRPRDLGRRAMAVNISDIGAMGGSPLYALVSLGLKSDQAVRTVEDIYRGLVEELNPFNASVIGGNITKVEQDFFIDITLIGQVKKGKLIRRSTAQTGDAILVTGFPGQAAAGLDLILHSQSGEEVYSHPLVQAYVRPAHRAHLGQALALSGSVTSMIDISDGLLADLGHLCQESRKGAELFREKLPLSPELKLWARRNRADAVDLCLKDSDDYELICTCPPDNADAIKKTVSRISPVPVTEIGKITDEAGLLQWINPDGSRTKIDPAGWDHFHALGENYDKQTSGR